MKISVSFFFSKMKSLSILEKLWTVLRTSWFLIQHMFCTYWEYEKTDLFPETIHHWKDMGKKDN